MIAPRNDTLFSTNSVPMSVVASKTPAMAGPITRPVFIASMFNPTAFVSSSAPTISCTNVWRAGLSNALIAPCVDARSSSDHKARWSVITRSPKAPTVSANVTCVAITRRRLSKRSATTPPSGPSANTGKYNVAVTRPSTVPPRCRRSSTSALNATICIQLPMTEMNWPMKKIRKFRTPKAAKRPCGTVLTSRGACAALTCGTGWCDRSLWASVVPGPEGSPELPWRGAISEGTPH